MSDLTPIPADKVREPLHRLAKPQPKPLGMPVAAEPGSGSATGFVSTLAAKRTFDASDTLSELARRSKEQLQMAREIPPARAKVAKPVVRKAPTWYRLALPVSIILAVMLLGIGGWAVGALLYMQQVMPMAARDVHYPLIVWSLEAGPMGAYTAASRTMAWAMVSCWPVAGMLVVMAGMLRRRIRAGR